MDQKARKVSAHKKAGDGGTWGSGGVGGGWDTDRGWTVSSDAEMCAVIVQFFHFISLYIFSNKKGKLLQLKNRTSPQLSLLILLALEEI